MKKILIIIAVIFVLVGLGFVLFEPVSNEIGRQEANRLVDEFDQIVSEAEDTADNPKKQNKSSAQSGNNDSSGLIRPTKAMLRKLMKDSREYNKKLLTAQGTVSTSSYKHAALNLRNYGITSNIYCYISAPKIGMKLPVYLGANESSLRYGAAHLSNTSLPVNQNSTNSVIAGHTGYIGRTFFDNIRSLGIGDYVSIKNYAETISYKVIKKKIIKPNYTRDLYVQYGRQLLTLYTCTRNSEGGFDRYLVICEKV